MTTDLATWLPEQIDEDERRAQRAQPGPWRAWPSPGMPGEYAIHHLIERTGQPDPHRVATTHGLGCAEADAEHIATWDTDRVLAECDAKRRIVEEHGHITVRVWPDRSQDFEVCTTCGSGGDEQGCTPWPCDTLKLLALPYADRPGYREEWRP